MSAFYLSFVDLSKPKGEQWLGACVVDAPNLRQAITCAHQAGCNPGGEVLGMEFADLKAIRAIERAIPREKWYRLLSLSDIHEPVHAVSGKPAA